MFCIWIFAIEISCFIEIVCFSKQCL